MTTTFDTALDTFEIIMKDDPISKLFNLWDQLEGLRMREHALSVLEILSKEKIDPAIVGYALGRIKSV